MRCKLVSRSVLEWKGRNTVKILQKDRYSNYSCNYDARNPLVLICVEISLCVVVKVFVDFIMLRRMNILVQLLDVLTNERQNAIKMYQ